MVGIGGIGMSGIAEILLDQGFEMVQLSVYARFAATKEKAESIARKVGKAVPPHGKVDILYFTDKQYSQIVSYRGKSESVLPKNPERGKPL